MQCRVGRVVSRLRRGVETGVLECKVRSQECKAWSVESVKCGV